jgi:hypothetical protein
MGNVIKKMGNQVPGRFLRLKVLLAAYMTKSSIDLGITIKAIFFGTFF